MEEGGEVAAKRGRGSDEDAGAGGEDRLSALPEDVLVLILLRLGIVNATRTSVLSRRWRRVWTLLPVIQFAVVRDSGCLPSTLSASDVPLRKLFVGDPDASSQSLATWLPAAALRVSGEMFLYNFVSGRRATEDEAEAEAEVSRRGTFELPCFEKATSIRVDLGFLGLSLPPVGVFARLTDLHLSGVRFHGPGELGDAVSSPRSPCLQNLEVHNVWGLDTITINSESLQLLELKSVRGLKQVTVVAPVLSDLSVLHCFAREQNQPIANISAPQLTLLKWIDEYDPSSVHLGSMEHLQTLVTFFFVYGQHSFTHNRACLMLVPRFQAVEHLILSLAYFTEVDDLRYLMEDMTVLPNVTFLHLIASSRGHDFGSCIFHVLRICSGIKQLMLVLSTLFDLEEQTDCSSGCICDYQPANWKTEELTLNHLQELEIEGFRASEHEIAVVKRLLNWVPVLQKIAVTFNSSISESKANELFQMFRSFSRPDLCIKVYIYQEFRKVLYAPED